MSATRVPTDLLERALALVREWEAQWGPLEPTAAGRLSDAASRSLLEQYVARLQDNYPFFHPRYAGQMLKPPHPVAIAAYLAAMVINPNNHALDGGPATGTMEKEVIRSMLGAFGLPEVGLGHLTTSGTIANLEAQLASEGASLSDVVKTTVFLRHMSDYAPMNETYMAAFGDHRPARSAIGVAELPLGALVEVEAWAWVGG